MSESANNNRTSPATPPENAAVRRANEQTREPLPEEMTLAQAAEFLDVSDLHLVRLIRRRELPCRKVGNRRRIPSTALVEYREKMFQRAREAAAEITRLSQEMGLYDLEGPPPRRQ